VNLVGPYQSETTERCLPHMITHCYLHATRHRERVLP